MPVNVPDKLPAIKTLQKENIFIMEKTAALRQNIRPQKIILLNIMPTKIATETQILRLLSNSPLQIELDLLYPKSYIPKNTPIEHLKMFYKSFDDIKDNKYDGLIITGAPVENIPFTDVTYWNELKKIMDWSKTNVTSTLFICWAAQAGLYHFYDIPKYKLLKKLSGIFVHGINQKNEPLVRGFDDAFLAPHSRYTEVRSEDINKNKELSIISESDEAGVYLVVSKDKKQVFVTGHSEYDSLTLKEEFERSINKGLDISVPKNYFPADNLKNTPIVNWRSHANLLFINWLNYYVYQEDLQ